MRYFGLTHHVPHWLLPLWRRVFCRVEWHALDEVYSPSMVPANFLSCDACGLTVVVSAVDTTYCKPARPETEKR